MIMRNKKISSNNLPIILWFIFLIVLVFILAVAYKFISTNIQEAKEKAIIDARQSEQQAEIFQKQNQTLQLDSCLNDASNKKASTVQYWYDFSNKTCTSLPANSSASIKCLQDVLDEFNKAKAQEASDKDDCYKRYK